MMNLSQLKHYLTTVSELTFILADNIMVPAHFHITEIGLVDKQYVDCGGTQRHDRIVSMQLRVAGDTDHRLHSDKLLSIIKHSESLIIDDSLQIQVEYQGAHTIQTYALEVAGDYLQLLPLSTNCLAQDACGITPDQLPPRKQSCCDGGCC